MLIQEEYFRNIFNTVREAILILDEEMRVLSANRSFFTIFKVDAASTIGSLLYSLGNRQWDIPNLRVLLEEILPNNDTVDDYEIEHDFESIGHKIMRLNACKIREKKTDQPIILLAIEDITERKELEELLTESEERYRRIFDTASDGIVLLEKHEGHIIHANPAAENMLGYAEEEYVGKMLEDIGVPLDMSDFPTLMQSLTKSGILNYDDVEVKTKSGHYIDTDIYLVDRAKLAQCNIRDVSERKMAEDALRESMARLDLALRSAGMGVWQWDITENKRYFDDQACHLLGINHATYTGSAEEFFKVVHTEDRETIKAALVRTVEQDVQYEPEYRAVWPDGSVHNMKAHGKLVRDDKGQPVMINGIVWDITERKQAEKDLLAALVIAHDQQARSEAIMTSMGEGLSIQNTDFVITYQNEAQKEIIGDHIGEHCYTAYENLDHVCEGCPVAMAYRDGGIHTTERAVTTGKGTMYVEITASPLRDMQGDIVAGIEIVRNVTDQKKLEDQLHHSQKMEAVGTLAGGIAHDFNNILNVIMGYGSMVFDKLEAGSTSKEHMSEILIAADKAAELTKRLLVFSRKQVVEVKPVNINALIVGLQKMLVRIIQESIDFKLALTGSPLIVLADSGQIEQVLINLVSNAKDAMQEGGQLTIGTAIEKMDHDFVKLYGYGKPGRYALITVSDTGQGMDAETQKKIFEPFFTTKGIGEGTGLGLAICYGIIIKHNGYIKVYSEPGKGTAFKIYLPLTEEEASPDKKTDAALPVKGGNETIMVCEDDTPIRTFLKILLESFGYTVISAEDGDDAIAKFMENRERISLVLLDMIMPKKNGKEVREALLKVSPGIKILYSSGYTMDIVKTNELTEARADFIHKPYQPTDLLKKVREILDR